MGNPARKGGASKKGCLEVGKPDNILRAPRKQQSLNGHGALRSVLESACENYGYSRADLTVLSVQVDPYRLDTPAGHRDGAWLAEEFERAFGPHRRTHWRGLHYALVAQGNVRKPNGEIYQNTDEDWHWLSDVAGKAARWLGYIPFDRITDNRNSEPVIHRKARVEPEASISVGLDLDIPDAGEIDPLPIAAGFEARQAFQFAIFGEKGSLEEVLLPLARRYDADLYLPSGEISDTLLYRMAKDADDDGRPLVVLTLSDFDPAGHQMPVSIGRKLQALRDLLFSDLEFEVVQAALTVDQVRDLGLPSTPLKDTEKRADRWREAFGVEQTEIDALATLRPRDLREIVDRAFDPYIDRTLEARVRQAETAWDLAAQEEIDRQVDSNRLEAIREQAAVLAETIHNINAELEDIAVDVELPPIEVPEPEVDADVTRQALVSADHDWIEATRALITHKAYGGVAS